MGHSKLGVVLWAVWTVAAAQQCPCEAGSSSCQSSCRGPTILMLPRANCPPVFTAGPKISPKPLFCSSCSDSGNLEGGSCASGSSCDSGSVYSCNKGYSTQIPPPAICYPSRYEQLPCGSRIGQAQENCGSQLCGLNSQSCGLTSCGMNSQCCGSCDSPINGCDNPIAQRCTAPTSSTLTCSLGNQQSGYCNNPYTSYSQCPNQQTSSTCQILQQGSFIDANQALTTCSGSPQCSSIKKCLSSCSQLPTCYQGGNVGGSCNTCQTNVGTTCTSGYGSSSIRSGLPCKLIITDGCGKPTKVCTLSKDGGYVCRPACDVPQAGGCSATTGLQAKCCTQSQTCQLSQPISPIQKISCSSQQCQQSSCATYPSQLASCSSLGSACSSQTPTGASLTCLSKKPCFSSQTACQNQKLACKTSTCSSPTSSSICLISGGPSQTCSPVTSTCNSQTSTCTPLTVIRQPIRSPQLSPCQSRGSSCASKLTSCSSQIQNRPYLTPISVLPATNCQTQSCSSLLNSCAQSGAASCCQSPALASNCAIDGGLNGIDSCTNPTTSSCYDSCGGPSLLCNSGNGRGKVIVKSAVNYVPNGSLIKNSANSDAGAKFDSIVNIIGKTGPEDTAFLSTLCNAVRGISDQTSCAEDACVNTLDSSCNDDYCDTESACPQVPIIICPQCPSNIPC